MSQSIHRGTDTLPISKLICVCSAVALTPLMPIAPAYSEEPPTTPAQLEFFEKDVRPLLIEHCYSCHSTQSKKLQAGLLVDSRAAILEGGDSGEAMVPGDPDASLIIEAVRYDNYEMPPMGKLSDDDILTLERWVAMGAPWPDEDAPNASTQQPDFDLETRKSEHWVWQPITSPSVPVVEDESWPLQDLDHFILSRLEQNKIQPALSADRSALLRRLCFDILGLPPSVEATRKFIGNTASDSINAMVDQLLESPQFGERWGRHWLDLVRYAESRGHEFDNDAPNAFQYRDYIIRALNADVPYDQLIREHIAGDLLSQPRTHPTDGFNESVLGTGFWFLGEWVHSPVDIRKDEADRFDNMIDVMSKAFLGVTVSCARCHDHKFDAISMADYYSLSGFLQSSDYRQVRFESMEQNRQVASKIAETDAAFRARVDEALSKKGIVRPVETRELSAHLEPAIVFDFARLDEKDFMQDGYIFGSSPRRAGEAYLDTSGTTPTIRFASHGSANSDPIWNGLESLGEKGVANRSKLAKLPRSGRTLRSPTFTVENPKVSCLVSGEGHVVACVDSHRLVAGPLHGSTIKPIKSTNKWIALDLKRYVGHRVHLEFTPANDAQLEVRYVVQGAAQELQKNIVERDDVHEKSVQRLSDEANAQLKETFTELAIEWAEARNALRAQIKLKSYTAMAMMDGTGEDDHILIRGNASKPGNVEPRHFLTAVDGGQRLAIESGSGRLELARKINADNNPLTARVIANRVWHYLMGRGIVPTTDDFGVLGQRPTHPELLDHLAQRFVRDGRSVKNLIRYIVLSRTYQTSSHADDSALAADPKNTLWHHRPPKRLEGEVIRDALLSLSGRLDLTQFGEPIPIHLTNFMDGRGRPGRSGPLDGAGRRTIYTAVRRNFLSPSMLAFDAPVPFSTMGRRNVSNVPAQALILMNDPLVVQQARQWATRTLSTTDSTPLRIQWMYESAFARQPTSQEMAAMSEYLDQQKSARGNESKEIDLWADIAHALINTKEFVFLR